MSEILYSQPKPIMKIGFCCPFASCHLKSTFVSTFTWVKFGHGYLKIYVAATTTITTWPYFRAQKSRKRESPSKTRTLPVCKQYLGLLLPIKVLDTIQSHSVTLSTMQSKYNKIKFPPPYFRRGEFVSKLSYFINFKLDLLKPCTLQISLIVFTTFT